MAQKLNRFIVWAPRILSIMLLAFLAMFSLDIFDGNYGFWGTIIGLFMHNIPVFILALVVWISWKREIVGGIVFILAGLLYITQLAITMMKNPPFHWYYLSWSLILAGPAILVGVLFLMGWFKKRKA